VTPFHAARRQSSATVVRARVGSKRSKDLKTARQTGALLRGVVALTEQAVEEVRCAHDGWEVDLQWGLRENSEIESREIVNKREVAPEACDPAPWLVANAEREW
jgi:hypothetical protein